MSLSAIRARLSAATPGPWWSDGAGVVYGLDGDSVAFANDNAAHQQDRSEVAAFIAAAPSDIERLLAVAEAAAAQPQYNKKRLREALARLDSEGSPL